MYIYIYIYIILICIYIYIYIYIYTVVTLILMDATTALIDIWRFVDISFVWIITVIVS